MIDVETAVFDAVYPFISPLVPEGGFVSEYVPQPASLPHVYLSEIGNVSDKKTADSGTKEWSAIITYEAQVFSMSREEVRKIAAAMDDGMVGLMGFTKLTGQMIPNAPDIKVFRYVARYERGVDRNGNLYKPT